MTPEDELALTPENTLRLLLEAEAAPGDPAIYRRLKDFHDRLRAELDFEKRLDAEGGDG